jgi:hypothetical protein
VGSGAVSRRTSVERISSQEPDGEAKMQLLSSSKAMAIALLVLAAVAAGGCHRRQQERQGEATTDGAGATPGAGGAAQPGARARQNRACELLTRTDAEELLGGPVKAPVTSITADIGVVSSRCGYISESERPVKVVTLLAKRWQNPADARTAYERAHALSQSISGQVPESVAGLGDRAYWAGGTVDQLNVLAGDTWLVISGTAGPGLDQLAPAKLAAAKILGRR